MTFTRDQLHAEAKRELGLRRRNYPRWVEEGRMDPAQAAHRIALMEAIVAALAPADLFSIAQESPPA